MFPVIVKYTKWQPFYNGFFGKLGTQNFARIVVSKSTKWKLVAQNSLDEDKIVIQKCDQTNMILDLDSWCNNSREFF